MTSSTNAPAVTDASWRDALFEQLRADTQSGGFQAALDGVNPLRMRGRVTQTAGLLVHASGIHARLGEVCELHTPGLAPMFAEVVGFSRQTAVLTPLGSLAGLSSATEVIPTGRAHTFEVGDALLGRVLNGLGEPLDGRGPITGGERVSAFAEPVGALERTLIDAPLPTGVRAIDGMLTTGIGQRVGIFAPAGVGKSTLLGMIARGAACDVAVVGLIGERGREVREFIEHNLSPEALARTVLVVSTSDRPAMERVKSAYVATAVAEYFRDKGLRVLLLVDSLTRFARAQREVGLASGEPPTRRSFPPSTFSVLPQLLERAGQGERGSITAFYTVLVEGEDDSDPIAEEVRSILDGHIVLSRKLAMAGHHPAIDVLASASRVMSHVTGEMHQRNAAWVREMLAKYQEIELLVQIGEYRAGSDALADAALAARAELRAFACQPSRSLDAYDDTVARLAALRNAYGQTDRNA
ncbi:FliI/YscN family ATPase [Trinickia fusca]|uniref:FliI/YscN family ATPase n=1 Tax=Trinickia fusca TaxID=2419777 RepID=A0A494XPA5_9BURK|nr:FliI/YscN family ATPase [Trinickia fusca]RKP50596.1 FliI/YscN family ATPase [Trinickia fusca]